MAHTIHFMWFGGPINVTSMESIRKWAEFLERAQEKISEQLKIAVWIDSEGSTEQAIHETKVRLAEIHNVSIEWRDISELREEHPEMHRIMRYEIDKLNANYSAASDVGRYTILEREAGMYLDTDVHPPEEVDSFIHAWKNTGVLITESASKDSIISNSDLLIAPEAHLPVLQSILQHIPQNYRTHYVEAPDDEGPLRIMLEYQYTQAAHILYQTYLARDQETIYAQAIKKAGPDMLKLHVLQDTEDQSGLDLLPDNITLESGSLRKSLELVGTAGSWIGRPTNAHDNASVVLAKISKTVDFELEYVGILRTDDHIQSAIESLGYYEPQDTEKINELIEEILELIQGKLAPGQASQVQCCQLTFKFAQTQAFYARNHLLIQTGLSPFTPEIGLSDICSKLYQPFATQHRILPFEQRMRNTQFSLESVQQDLVQASLDFRAKLLLFYQTQYHEKMVDGILKFGKNELKKYLEILESVSLSDLAEDIQDVHSQLVTEAQAVQLKGQRISRVENIRVRMTELRLSTHSENDLISRLTAKITKLESIENKTKQQTDKLNLLLNIQNAQREDFRPLKSILENNKGYIIGEIGVETFVLSLAILDRKMNSVAQDNRDDDVRAHL